MKYFIENITTIRSQDAREPHVAMISTCAFLFYSHSNIIKNSSNSSENNNVATIGLVNIVYDCSFPDGIATSGMNEKIAKLGHCEMAYRGLGN
jgi:hypothetical protein